MADAKAQQPGNASRVAAILAVVVLIMVAIAGIVLADRQRAGSTDGRAGSTDHAGAPPTVKPVDVRFEPGSDKVPPAARTPIAEFAEAARSAGGLVRVISRYATGDARLQNFDLAKSRAGALQHAMEADGVDIRKVQIELSEVPAAGVGSGDVDRLQLLLQ